MVKRYAYFYAEQLAVDAERITMLYNTFSDSNHNTLTNTLTYYLLTT